MRGRGLLISWCFSACSPAPSHVPEDAAVEIIPCATASERLCLTDAGVPDGMSWCAVFCVRPCDATLGDFVCTGEPECSADESERPSSCD